MSLHRFGLELPARVKGKLTDLGMMPDFAAWGENLSSLHQRRHGRSSSDLPVHFGDGAAVR
jgi:hypothetical protein